MIFLKNTPNYAGVTVCGDSQDFDSLYRALHMIVGEEGEWSTLEGARLRVLGVCYDIRHALMGNREFEFVHNGLDHDMMRRVGMIANDKNVYLAFNVLWPELLFVTMALNDFVTLYARKQAKNSYNATLDYRSIWDPAIAQVRGFQAAVNQCLQETISEASISRVLKMMVKDYTWYSNYATQYLDELNIKFIGMNKEKRLKNITVMAKRLSEFGDDYRAVEEGVKAAAREYNVSVKDIRSVKEYPEEIDW